MITFAELAYVNADGESHQATFYAYTIADGKAGVGLTGSDPVLRARQLTITTDNYADAVALAADLASVFAYASTTTEATPTQDRVTL